MNKTFSTIGLGGTILLAASLLAGCSTYRTGAPPTGAFNSIYDTKTNYVPVVQPVTNFVPVTLYETNHVTVTLTNEQNVIAYKTNEVIIPHEVQQPQVVLVTNQEAHYQYTEKPAIKDTTDGVATAVNVFAPGIGTLVGTGITALIGLIGWFRSSKDSKAGWDTATTLAQNIQDVRSFLQKLPNGTQYDQAFKDWLVKHQTETDTISNVAWLLKNEVSQPQANFAAQQIIDTIDALNRQTVVTTPPPIPPGSASAPKV